MSHNTSVAMMPGKIWIIRRWPAGSHLWATNSAMVRTTPAMAKRLLHGLKDSQGKATLKHVRSLAAAIFKHAVNEEILTVNPWREIPIPDDAVESAATEHYTIGEAEDMISALVDRVDCQLILALSCFLGLRPGEVAAVRWEDFDSEEVHIRRSVVRGKVGTPKTLEALADLPLIDR